MTAFLILALFLTAAALMFVLPPLLSKDLGTQQHAQRDAVNLSVLRDQMRELDADLAAGTINGVAYESAKIELERRVLEDVQTPAAATVVATSPGQPRMALLVALCVPVLAISLYFLLGSPAALDPTQVSAPADQAHAGSEEQMLAMITALEQRLKEKPENAEGWDMLARSYHTIGKFREAADAYAQLVKLVPDNADLLADYADTLAMAQNRSLQGEPEKIIARALIADPKNIKAIALAGSAAFDRRDYQSAVTQWKKILLLVPPESETARSTMGSIGEAQSLAGEPVTALAGPLSAPAAAAAAPVPTAQSGAIVKVEGVVELDAALRSKVSDTDSVFIFARAAEGPKFPLAVLRKQVRDLPANFVLDDSMSMVPNAKLSNFPMVIVGARVSKSGNATPSAGDFEGATEAVRPGATGLKIRINSERK